MIDRDGNESKTIYEACLLEKLKTAKADAVKEFFDEMIAECSGSDNGVDDVLCDSVINNTLKPFAGHYIDNIKVI